MILTNTNKHSWFAFDIGQVLARVNMSVFLDKLIELKYCESEYEADLFSSSIQAKFDTGMIDMRQALYLHFKHISKTDMDQLVEAWMKVVTPCQPTLDVISQLISEGAKIALLSNIGRDHADYLSNICSEQFDRCVKHFSCDVGARKPTKLYFQSFSMELIRSHTPVLFLDDRLENVEAANAQGFNGQIFDIDHYSSDEEAAKDLIKLINSF